MPRGAAIRGRLAARGFSLIELLVVMTIIGILAGAVVLYTGVVGQDREAEREMSRLSSLIDLLREEALMQSRDFGLLMSQSAYRFYVYDYQQGRWVEPVGDRLIAAHELPERLTLSLELDGRPVRLEPELDADALEMPEPQVMILSSGEVTPFFAAVGRELAEGRYTLTADLDGTLEVAADGFDRR